MTPPARRGRPPEERLRAQDSFAYGAIHASTDGMTRRELAGLLRMADQPTYRLLLRLHAQGRISKPDNNRDGRWKAAGAPDRGD